MKRLVIIGGGFAGLYLCKSLKRKDVQVILIDKRNHHLFQPLLYQVATGGLSPGDIAYPLRAVLAHKKNIQVVQDEVIDFDKTENKVITKKGEYVYDMLVIATGTQNFYFGKDDEWAKHAPGLKSIGNALEMRGQILSTLEKAELETDPILKSQLLHFAIIGGGPTGVELAGALSELCYNTLKESFRTFNANDIKIELIEASSNILGTYSKSLTEDAKAMLQDLNVIVNLDTKVLEIDDQQLVLEHQGVKITKHVGAILWGAGVRSNSINTLLEDEFQAEIHSSGRVKIDAALRLPNYENVYVLGDLAYLEDRNGTPLPGIAPVAIQQGQYLAKIINKGNMEKASTFSYLDKGSLAVIGRNRAIAQIGKIELKGFFAWLIWIFVHIAYLIGFDSKLLVLIQWGWNYVTRKRGALLITE